MPIFPTGYTQKTTPADDDQVLIGDSAASNAIKRLKISSIITKASAAAIVAISAVTNWITTAMLQNGSVTKGKISFDSGVWWEELGRATVTSGTPTSMSTGTFTPKKYIRIIYVGLCNNVMTEFMRFNNDSGNNYIRAVSENGAADGAPAYSASGLQGGGSQTQRFFTWDFLNIASRAKMGRGNGQYGQGTDSLATSGNQPIRAEFNLKWTNTSQQISRVDIVCTGGNLVAGSEIIVLGHD